jgi:hypothetical protein
LNDFGIDITGFTGLVRNPPGMRPRTIPEKERWFKLESGSGCKPELGTNRKVKGHWLADNYRDTINSYDLEYVLDPKGKRVSRLPEEKFEVEVVGPTKESPKSAPLKVKRKK